MRRVVMLAAVVGAALGGCFGHAPQKVRRNSTAEIQPAARDVAYSRALQAIQRRGWIVAVSDRAGGVLSTQTMQGESLPCGISMCPSRSALQVTITETGAVTVNLHRELYAMGLGGPGTWFIPTAEPAVLAIEAEQDAILAEITGEARR